MGAGLKDQWGVGAPAKAGSDQQSQQFRAAFQSEINAIGKHLEYTAANAEPERHQPLATRRDALYPEFQGALKQVDKDNPGKAQGVIAKVLGLAKGVNTDAAKLHTDTEKAKADWDARQPKFDEAVKHVEELEAWDDPKAKPLRTLVDGIRKQVNERKYAPASKTLDELLPKLQPIYDAYLTQKQAKEKYDAQFKELNPKLPKASLPEDKMPAADQKAIADARGRMDSAAQAKDFVKANEWLESLSQIVTAIANRAALNGKEDPDVIIFEGKELRADKDLVYKILLDMIESKGIKSGTDFSQRFQQSADFSKNTNKRPGLFPDICQAFHAANQKLDTERKKFCGDFEATAKTAAEGLLDRSKKTIEAELKRLGIIDGPPQVDSGSAGGTARPGFTLSNPEAAKSAKKAAADLLPFAEAVEKTHKESQEAYEKFKAAQRGDPLNFTSRPLAEKHQTLRKQWQEASEAYEKARRPAVAANPALAMFAEQPGMVAKLTTLTSMSDADFGNKVGEEAQRRLKNIEEVKGEIGGRFSVWKQPHLMRVTLDEMKATPFQRESVEMEARDKKTKADDDKQLFTLVALGLGLVAIGATLTGWGIGLAGAAGGELAGLMAGISTAAGGAGGALSLYQLGEQADEYTLATAANATDFDKAKAISLEEPSFLELALNCVLAIGDVFAAAAAFKAIGPLVKAVKGGDVMAALKLGSAAEAAGIRGAAKTKIVGEAVSGLSGEAIEKVAKSMSRSGGATEAACRRVVQASAGASYEAELARAMELIQQVSGRIPDTARKMIQEGRVFPLTVEAVEHVYTPAVAVSKWPEVRELSGFYCRTKKVIFLRAANHEELAGTLIHEATHRVGNANAARGNDFMAEAIAHFAEQDFYNHIYGPNGSLHGTEIRSDHIKKMIGMTDQELLAYIEEEYRVAPKGLSKTQRDLFAQKGVTAEQVLEQVWADLAAHYQETLTNVP